MPGDFFDTNILVYLASDDRAKAERAHELIEQGGTISVQVLNELANVARKRLRLSWEETDELLDTFRELLTVRDLTLDTHRSGVALARRYRWSIYDGLIVASALEAGSKTLWSEDLQHGMKLDEGLRIADPFR